MKTNMPPIGKNKQDYCLLIRAESEKCLERVICRAKRFYVSFLLLLFIVSIKA